VTATRRVAVVGPGTDADPDLLSAAREVGRLLADAGAVVVTGGLGGVMAAAAAGAAEAGGTSVGILPGDDPGAASAGHTVVVPTGLGEMRNALVVRSADAVIAVGGSWGTLSEVALARRTGRPVVVLRGWRVLDAGGAEVDQTVADSPADAVRLVMTVVHPTR
jgi:uncharacterized protein (TIGR00725 family)